MLSYQHIYHAGGFADVHKHAVLSILIEHLKKKPAPFFILDAHGGRGLYPLAASEAQKTAEFETGIGKIWPKRTEAPPVLAPYFTAIEAAGNGREITHYPGSPLVALALMRKDDRFAAVEKHPGEITHLRKALAPYGKQASVHERDAYEALLALVPPKEKRGLVLIDPSYEDKKEYEFMPGKIAAALKKWPQGIFAIWYPVLPARHHEKLIDEIKKLGVETLVSQFDLEQSPMVMTGSGMIVINPPWKLDDELDEAGKWLGKILLANFNLMH